MVFRSIRGSILASLSGVVSTVSAQAPGSNDRQSFLGVLELGSATDYRPDEPLQSTSGGCMGDC